jgi:hypothetical protein
MSSHHRRTGPAWKVSTLIRRAQPAPADVKRFVTEQSAFVICHVPAYDYPDNCRKIRKRHRTSVHADL